MKYRIQKYNIFPPHLDNVYSPTYSVEYKKHWWNKWEPLHWTTDATGRHRIPQLVMKSEAVMMIYKLTNTTCLQCKHCYGRVGEAEYQYRRCRIRKADDGTEKVIYGNPYACDLFEKENDKETNEYKPKGKED